MQYGELQYIPEAEDPSLTIETANLVARIIDNTGLLAPPTPDDAVSNFTKRIFTPYTHRLGYHGIRTLYDKSEKRNIVSPFFSWLNLQGCGIAGIETDDVDERATYGVGRGWPMRMEPKGAGALLTIDPLPNMQMRYTLELQPAEPDGIDFSVRFELEQGVEDGPTRLRASWPCYTSAYDDVRLFYPQGRSP
ncbi:MAG: hypothetical protein GY700_13610, partial [Propionibacteriaceae bacterium]|nr:hypothetical protein [Propionibacteriaceae bacterium]